MSLLKGTDKKTEKKLKKLSVWIKKLQKHKIFEIGKNATYDLSSLILLPISAALNKNSIEYERTIEERISPNNFYHHFNNKLTEEKIRKMFFRYVNEIIKVIKNIFNQSSYSIAIDKTEDLYWGDTENLFVTGGKRKSSTNYAFRYLTAAIALPDFEFTIYARPLTKDDKNDALLVEECINAVKKLGIGISRILMDREFFNSKIILVSNVKQLEYVIPVVKNSRFKSLIKELKKEGKKLPRIIENYKVDEQLTNIVIYEDKNSKGKTEIFGFITNIETDKIKKDVYEIAYFYRRRWAIENANKFQDSFNIHTNSTNDLARYFFFALAALLHNFWVIVNLFTKNFYLCKVSLNMIKNILKAMFELDQIPNYKHAQRKLWLGILLG